MKQPPSDLRYTEQHEWLRAGQDGAVMGITDYAQQALGDITFVELPAVGQSFSRGDAMVVIESVKAASDVYAPVSGSVMAVNTAVEEDPAAINHDPFGDGWLVKISVDDAAEIENLLTAEAYARLAGTDD